VEWRSKALVDELDEFVPRRLATVLLEERVPLGCFTRHVECGGLLDAKELVAPIEPRQRVIRAVKGGEEELVPVFSDVRDDVIGAGGRCLGGRA
jgi:hypothetical protein